jgi:hypothetical protein
MRDNGCCRRLGSADRARDAQRCFHGRWKGLIDRRRLIQSGQWPFAVAIAPRLVPTNCPPKCDSQGQVGYIIQHLSPTPPPGSKEPKS